MNTANENTALKRITKWSDIAVFRHTGPSKALLKTRNTISLLKLGNITSGRDGQKY
jgi:hypothetical protein